MGTLFSLVDKLVSSLAPTLVALIFWMALGTQELPNTTTTYSTGIKVAIIIMFCVIPMLAWAATLWAMKGYSLTGAKMKEIQAVNSARKAAVNDGMTLEQAMDTIKTTEDAEKYQDHRRQNRGNVRRTSTHEKLFPLVRGQRPGDAGYDSPDSRYALHRLRLL